ncbi:MAG: hypothetical protein COB17_02470, partial [Sulfurimonas sp.]
MKKLLLSSVMLLVTSLSATTATQENVAKLYVATFNRAPDTAGLNYWVNTSGLELEGIAKSFFDQEETKTLYPDTTSDRDFIGSVYQNLFNRAPDADGLAYWEAELSAGTISKNRFIEAVINGAQDNTTSNDASILTNKTTVGLNFANAGIEDPAEARNVMIGVSDDITTVDTAQNKIILSSGYPVVVERGAVLDANVTDANGSVAIQVSDTNNTYVFATQPVYPITATGGWIDINGDGNLTEADVALDINLTSYTNNITPTTTYIADANATIRKQKLDKLALETNTTTQDLLNVPSKASTNAIVVLNAIFEKLIEKDDEDDDTPLALELILQRFLEIGNNTNTDVNGTSQTTALSVEDQTILYLVAKGLIKHLDFDDILKIKIKKTKKLKDKDHEKDEEEKGSDEKDEDKNDSDYKADTLNLDNNATIA